MMGGSSNFEENIQETHSTCIVYIIIIYYHHIVRYHSYYWGFIEVYRTTPGRLLVASLSWWPPQDSDTTVQG